jgi:hypothetical protein
LPARTYPVKSYKLVRIFLGTHLLQSSGVLDITPLATFIDNP